MLEIQKKNCKYVMYNAVAKPMSGGTLVELKNVVIHMMVAIFRLYIFPTVLYSRE